MRRQTTTVGRGLARFFPARPLQRGLSLLLRGAQDTLPPTVGLLHLDPRRLNRGEACLQISILTAEGVGIHALE